MNNWIDVTGEYRFEKVDGACGGACILARHDSKVILLCRDGGTNHDDYRWRWSSETEVRIDRCIEVPDLKWTVETVGAVDWSKVSEIETVRADYEHWYEQIEHARITGEFEGPLDSRDCPSCQRHRKSLYENLIYSRCHDKNGRCSLYGGADGCCNGLYFKFADDRTIENADPVCDYIKAKLDELEAEAADKGKVWEPRLFEWVKLRGKSGWRVVFSDGTKIKPCLVMSAKNGMLLWVNLFELSPDDTGGAK